MKPVNNSLQKILEHRRVTSNVHLHQMYFNFTSSERISQSWLLIYQMAF